MPQLAAVLSHIDQQFAERAVKRLIGHCKVFPAGANETASSAIIGGSENSRFYERSCKMAAPLVRLLEADPKHESMVVELRGDAVLAEMIAKDVHAGVIAVRWRERILDGIPPPE